MLYWTWLIDPLANWPDRPKVGQWVNGSVRQVHYTSHSRHLTADIGGTRSEGFYSKARRRVTSCLSNGFSKESSSAFGPSDRAFWGLSWTSMNTPSTPAATPALARCGMYCGWPPELCPWPPGSCRLCVTSKITGHPNVFMMGKERKSTTRLL